MMQKTWRFIDSHPFDACRNMAIDEAVSIMVQRGRSEPTLRFYGWSRPSVTLGSFQKIGDINLEYCNSNDIPVVRRPTGGRAILHDNELTYSFSSGYLPPYFSDGLINTYGYLGKAFYDAIKSLGIEVEIRKRREKGEVLTGSALCFQSTSYGELSIRNRKVIGSAQKRWKDGFLQQGSIQFVVDADGMEKVFREADYGEIRSAMIGLSDVSPILSPAELRTAVIRSFEDTFNVEMRPDEISEEEHELALRLQEEKYESREWTFSK